MALAGEELFEEAALDVPVAFPVPPVAETLVAEAFPEQRDDAPLGPELEVADGGHATASSRSGNLTGAPPSVPPCPSQPAG